MTNTQPIWQQIAQLGDVHPVEYGGYWIFTDETGVYGAEAELLDSPDHEDGKYFAYRFGLDRCTFIAGVLSDNRFHPDKPAWFADRLASVAEGGGSTLDDIIAMFCSDDAIERAAAYRMIGDYHGFDNLDSYPLVMTRAEAEARYSAPLYA